MNFGLVCQNEQQKKLILKSHKFSYHFCSRSKNEQKTWLTRLHIYPIWSQSGPIGGGGVNLTPCSDLTSAFISPDNSRFQDCLIMFRKQLKNYSYHFISQLRLVGTLLFLITYAFNQSQFTYIKLKSTL